MRQNIERGVKSLLRENYIKPNLLRLKGLAPRLYIILFTLLSLPCVSLKFDARSVNVKMVYEWGAKILPRHLMRMRISFPRSGIPPIAHGS